MYAIIACKGCRTPWTVELRSATASCPHCGSRNEVRKRTRIWEGEDAREAQQVAGHYRAALAKGLPTEAALTQVDRDRAETIPRHDSPIDAAAAKARTIVNKSERAETVALWLTRLVGAADHDTYLEALTKAGIARVRAEKEVVRMLATDIIFEPQAGTYRVLGE